MDIGDKHIRLQGKESVSYSYPKQRAYDPIWYLFPIDDLEVEYMMFTEYNCYYEDEFGTSYNRQYGWTVETAWE